MLEPCLECVGLFSVMGWFTFHVAISSSSIGVMPRLNNLSLLRRRRNSRYDMIAITTTPTTERTVLRVMTNVRLLPAPSLALSTAIASVGTELVETAGEVSNVETVVGLDCLSPGVKDRLLERPSVSVLQPSPGDRVGSRIIVAVGVVVSVSMDVGRIVLKEPNDMEAVVTDGVVNETRKVVVGTAVEVVVVVDVEKISGTRGEGKADTTGGMIVAGGGDGVSFCLASPSSSVPSEST